MKIDINESKKILILWRTSAEANKTIPKKIQGLFREYRERKFRVFIMDSGSDELFDSTLLLLRNNRMKAAEQEVKVELDADREAG